MKSVHVSHSSLINASRLVYFQINLKWQEESQYCKIIIRLLIRITVQYKLSQQYLKKKLEKRYAQLLTHYCRRSNINLYQIDLQNLLH